MMDEAYPVRHFCCRDISTKKMKSYYRDETGFFSSAQPLLGPVRGETGVDGLRLDFNDGLRLEVPKGKFHVRISDADSEMVFFDDDVSGVRLQSMEKFYVRWQIDVHRGGALVFSHTFDPTGQQVFFVDCSTLLGDSLVVIPYLRAFREQYGARVSCCLPPYLGDFARRMVPEIEFRDTWPEDCYATFYFGASIDTPALAPEDGRFMPMEELGHLIFGVPRPRQLPVFPAGERQIQEPYVCIGVQASHPAKGWLYPDGWEIVTAALREAGYRVLCIDKERENSADGFSAHMPAGAEDFTGERPIEERAELLAHADFFIGLGSGLSWLAYFVGCPVVMICGFSESWYEFDTPYRVYNRLVCHGCLNDVRENYFRNPCPRQPRGSEKILECQKTITPRMVLDAIRRLQQDRERMA